MSRIITTSTSLSSFDIRSTLLVTLALALFSIILLQPARPPVPPPVRPPARPPVRPLAPPAHNLERTQPTTRLLSHRLTSEMPACASGRAKTFLMVFMGHSASTAIMTSLQQHSQTHIKGLEPVDHGIYRAGKSSQHSLRALAYTNDFFANATKHGLTAGFKIRPPNILARPTEFAQLIKRYDTRVIWSYRTNIFKQAISDYNIHYYDDKAGHEGLRVENGTVQPQQNRSTTVRIQNMGNLHNLLKSRIRGEKEVEEALRAIRSDGCVLPVSYESYLRHPHVILKRVQVFLGLDTQEMHPSLRAKANSDTICDLVENWDQVCAAFFRCVQWRWMLDDFENGCSCTSLNPSRFRDSQKYCTLT